MENELINKIAIAELDPKKSYIVEINIDNVNYSINIYTNKKLVNKDALSDILEYIKDDD